MWFIFYISCLQIVLHCWVEVMLRTSIVNWKTEFWVWMSHLKTKRGSVCGCYVENTNTQQKERSCFEKVSDYLSQFNLIEIGSEFVNLSQWVFLDICPIALLTLIFNPVKSCEENRNKLVHRISDNTNAVGWPVVSPRSFLIGQLISWCSSLRTLIHTFP